PGMLLSEVGYIPLENDCTHFISHCIGKPPEIKINGIPIRGGGLPITQPFKSLGVYGHTTTPTLIQHLVNWGFATVVGPPFVNTATESTRTMISEQLRPGDLLGYASQSGNSIMHGKYEHLAILVGPTSIACHTASRFGEPFTAVWRYPWLTLLK